jgi:citrate lyase beta subunit
MRARRALMYMPADDLHKIQKAISLQVDCICMDLEDAVAASRKSEARATAVQALSQLNFGRSEKVVRINPVESGLALKDLEMVLPAGPDGIVVPKVDSASALSWVDQTITAAEAQHGRVAGSTALIALIESPRAVLDLRSICEATPRLQALVFGGEDMVAGLGAVRTPDAWEVFYARSAVVLHAAAFGLQAIDKVTIDFRDDKKLRRDAQQGMELGFSGKQIIHPNQVKLVQEIFTPSEESIEKALSLVAAFESHQQVGAGAFELDGQMVDAPLYKAAKNLLARAGYED